jgi:hypothetical protein
MFTKQLAGTLAVVAALGLAAVGWTRDEEPAPPLTPVPAAQTVDAPAPKSQGSGAELTAYERAQLAAERREERREAREDARERRQEAREDAVERREEARENAVERAQAKRGCIDD